MILLATIINQFKERLEERYSLLPGHIRALKAMARCRQEHGPHMLAKCSGHDCGNKVYIPHSCGHRSCPHCQLHESQLWIEKQLGNRVPATYYLLTFTLPAQLRELAWKNQKTVYSLMFSCAQELLKSFTGNDRKLGGAPGFTAILHTHTRNLEYHPHIHVVMPGASINRKTGLWRVKNPGYLFNHKAMAKVFRAKLLQALVAHGLPAPTNCPHQWVVDCKEVGKGDKAIIYLGRYLYRGVIREQDILRCENGSVTFRYLHAKTGEYRTRTVSGEYFLYLLMLHVLPKGFRRARCYGFLHPCSKKLVRFLQLVLRINPHTLFAAKLPARPRITCPSCGAKMTIIATRLTKPPSLLPKACPVSVRGYA
jgi:hypothetical protein